MARTEQVGHRSRAILRFVAFEAFSCRAGAHFQQSSFVLNEVQHDIETISRAQQVASQKLQQSKSAGDHTRN